MTGFNSYGARSSSIASVNVTPATVCGGNDIIIYELTNTQGSTNTNTSSFHFTTTGTYTTSDITTFKLYTNTSNTLTGATLVGSVAATLAGAQTISYSTFTMDNSATDYWFIVATVALGTGAHNISVLPIGNHAQNVPWTYGATVPPTITGSSLNTGGLQTLVPGVASLTGTTTVCVGSVTTLSSATGGGTWSSTTTSIATVNSSGGVFGVSAGTSVISYYLNSSCPKTLTVSVNASPASISPGSSVTVCSGSVITLSDATTGGTWSVTNGTGTASISAGGGLSGGTAGNVTVSYTTTGCNPTTRAVSVNTQPTAITGTASVCVGSVTTLASTPGGGNWSSVTTANATVNSSGGVFGVAGGTSVISYAIGTCAVTKIATVNAAPGSISGASSVCSGSVTTMSDGTIGGTWSVTGGTGTASISAGGGLSGGTAGTVTVSYTTAGCNPSTYPFTVNTQPAGITGTASVCSGSVTTLADATGGGSWTSVTTAVATVSGSSVFGVSTGTSLISYTIGNCASTRTVTVNGSPAPITGTTTVCAPIANILVSQNFNTGLTGQVGGLWTVTNTGGASVYNWALTAAGAYTDVSISGDGSQFMEADPNLAGSAVTLTTVLRSPSFSTVGMASVSVAFNHYFQYLSPDVAKVDYSLNGTTWVNITTYAATSGSTSWTVGTPSTTLNLPAGALGQPTVYVRFYYNSNFGWMWAVDNVVITGMATSTTTLTETSTGGAWSSSAPSIATVTSGGVVTGLAVGTADISYINPCGYAFRTVTVLGVPAAISGNTSVIGVGLNNTLSDATAYGTWTSGTPSVATVDPVTGVVWGVSPGNSQITYSTGCSASTTTTVTVANLCTGTPTPGTPSVSPLAGNASTTFTLSTTGYTPDGAISFQWQKSTTSGSSGFTDIAGGTTPTYNYTAGITVQTWFRCVVTCGTSSLSSNTTAVTATYYPLSSCTPSWIYGNYACTDGYVVATTGHPFVMVGASGSISDNSACSAAGYHDLSSGSYNITLNAGNTYSATMGALTFSTTMSDQIWIDFNGNGTFESGESVAGTATWGGLTNTESITIPTGSAVTTGTYRMRVEAEYYYHHYPNLNPCPNGTGTYYYGDVRDYKVTIMALPLITAAGGATSICQGANLTLSNATGGGTWSSSDAGIVFINSTTGVATGGGTTGTATISYTAGGIVQTTTLANLAIPTPITGSNVLCTVDNITLTEAVTGGAWASSSTSVATVSASGVVYGVAPGTTNISYSTGCGSPAVYAVTVNSVPGTITASTTVMCTGGTASLSNTTSGGTWSSSDATIASIDPSSGLTGAVGGGIATISYSMGCVSNVAVKNLTIDAAPATITPISTVDMCIGLTVTLSNTSYGGSWTSNAPGIATVNSSTGVVGGVSAGTTTITYSNICGAPATRDVNVNTPPNGTISGTSPVCQYANTNLTNSVSGGAWFSSNTAIATVDAFSGQVGGGSGGSVTISYLISGCNPVTRAITVTPVPAAIGGFTTLCPNTSTTLNNSVPSGTWTSSATSIATINSVTGFMGATATPGTTTITYDNGCTPAATQVVTVSGSASPISGTFTLCSPSPTTIYTEDWENGVPTVPGTPVDGWTVVSGSANPTYFFTEGSDSDPSASAQHGNNMLMFNSFSLNSGTADIASPSFSMAGITAGTLKVWVYRDCDNYNSATYNAEGFTFYVNTAPNLTGASSMGLVPRRGGRAISGGVTGTSTTTTSGWFQYTCTIPASYNGVANAYIIIHANSLFGDNCLLDNMVVSGTLGSSTILTDGTPGGFWSSGTPANVTVNSSTGLITSVAAGTSNITYTAACGSPVSQVVTVNPLPGTFTGATTICQNTNTTWTNAGGSGTWTSSNTAVATVNASTGVIGGVSGGTATITFANGCGSAVTKTMTVTAIPGAITGSTSLCPGGTGTLVNTVTGGTWTSGTPSVATVNSATGVVGAVAASGSTTITYSNGCAPSVNATVTISSTPGAIGGPTTLCAPTGIPVTVLSQNFNTGLTGQVGGNWSIVNGAGSAAVWFRLANPPGYSSATPGDGSQYIQASPDASSSNTVTDFRSPAFSTLGMSVGTLTFNQYYEYYSTGDVNASIQYSINGGSTWTTIVNQVSGAANVGTSSWIVGSPTTTLTLPAGALNQTSVLLRWYYQSTFGFYWTVDNIILQGIIAPSVTLTDPTPGGSWSSITGSVASITTSTGQVFAVGAGTSNISYSTACGAVGTTITVNPVPGAISGTTLLCAGDISTLTNTVSGGIWASSDPTIASVNASTGLVTAIASGTATISYSTSCGSAATTSVTVKSLPAAITGSTSLCPSTSGTLYNASAYGTWTSSDPTVASVNSVTGAITATALGGTSTITYGNGCAPDATTMITVSGVTAPIAGTTSVCVPLASPTLLTQSWETPAGSAVPAGTTPVNGWFQLSAPATNYFYSETSGGSPAASPQSGSYFLGFYNYFSAPTQNMSSPTFSLVGTNGATLTFYVWRDITSFYNNSSYGLEGFTIRINTSASLTGATTLGFVPRAAALPVTGSYITGTSTTTSAGWYQYTCVLPASFTGSASNYIIFSCASNGSYEYSYLDNIKVTANPFTGNLTDATPGGAWTTSNATIASVNTLTGVFSGLSAGTATITYTGPCGTPVNQTVTINGYPASIGGLGSMCIGASLNLTNSATGGTWTSGSPSVATINAATGVVTGVSAGTALITYSNGCGSQATGTVTVKSPPSAILGATSMCPSSSTLLTDGVTGGSWTSSDPTVATIGVFSGSLNSTSLGGTTTITYGNGCAPDVTSVVTVSSSTATVVGNSMICGAPTPVVYTSFENGVPGTAGTPVDSWNYVQGTGAANNYWVSVTGTSTTNPASGGVPSGGGTKVAQFSSKTITSGNTAALVSPSFDLSGGANGGKVSFYFYRDATAGALSIYDSVALYINTSPVISGGTWMGSVCRSKNLATAFTGTAVAGGWFKYTYNIPSSYSGATNYLIVKGYSGGGDNMYMDSLLIKNNSHIMTLTDATSGGTWSTDDPTVATVNALGVVTAVSAGSTNINYTGACGSPQVQAITVNPVPGGNTNGGTIICVGSTTTVANALSGGTWYSSAPAVATVDASGNVSGLSAGIAVISYFNGCGAAATTSVTVNAVPTVAAITASSSNLCTGTTLTLTAGAVTGSGVLTSYNWSGPNSYMAASTGTNTSFTPTTTAASGGYSLSVTYPGNGCTSASAVTSSTVTVNNRPTISGISASVACVGSTMTLTSSGVVGAGSLVSYNWSGPTGYTSTAVPNAVRIPTATTAGGVYSLTVTYAGTGCTSAVSVTSPSVTINPALVAGSITGSTTLLTGGVITLTGVGASGGTGSWSSNNTAVATTSSTGATGSVYGVNDGTATISYTTTNPCGSSVSATVNVTTQSPPVITGVSNNVGIPGSTITISGFKFNSTAANNVVMFGATKGVITDGSSTSLAVTIPTGATFGPINVLNTANGLSGFSPSSFTPKYDTTLFIVPEDANSVNFLPKVDFGVGTAPNIAAIGDLDGDGKPELVSVNTTANTISIYHNVAATGVISGSSFVLYNTFTTASGPQNVKIADMDGDGKPEILVTCKTSSQVSIFHNTNTVSGTMSINGTRLDYSTISSSIIGSGPVVLAIADIDGDGKPDIITQDEAGSSLSYANVVSVLRNRYATIGTLVTGATPSFATAVTAFTGGGTLSSGSVSTADFDGDGKKDIIVTDQASGSVSILPNNSYSGSIVLGPAISLVTGAATTTLSTGATSTEVSAGDIDGDGFPDIVVTNYGSDNFSIFLNTNTSSTPGSFTFGTRMDVSTGAGSQPVGLALADVTGDGLLDIVVGKFATGANTVSVFRNKSTPGAVTLATAVSYTTGATTTGVVVGDLDGDTYPDIVTANQGANTMSVIKNYPLPHVEPITGTLNVCSDGSGSSALSDATPTGVWSLANAINATISGAGVVTGLARGTDIATYTKTVRGQVNYTTANISVKQGVSAVITASTASICSGGMLTLNTTTPAYLDPLPPAYAWNGPGIATTTGLSINGSSTITPVNVSTITVTGMYSVTIHPVDGVCADFVATTGAVAVNPQPSVTVNASRTGIVCVGLSETLTSTVVGGSGAATYAWSGPGLAATTSSTSVYSLPITYDVAGPFNVTVSYTDATCIPASNITAVVTPTKQAWVGGTLSHENDWNTDANWTCGTTPTVSDDITIAAGTYVPVIASSASGTSRNIAILAGATVSLAGSATLNVKGNVTNQGTVTGEGTFVLNGLTPQTIDSVGTIDNMELNNSNGATIRAFNTRVTIVKSLTLTSGTLATSDSLVLASSDTMSSARVAPITTAVAGVTGKVQVQQFVQGGYRRFRFMSHPFNSAISLSQLQNSIDITGNSGSANGFTTTGSNSPSAFRYDPYSANSSLSYDPGWLPFTSILPSAASTNQFNRYQGIRIFLRGAKGEGLGYWFGYTPSSAVITMAGVINQGDQTITLSKGSATVAGSPVQEYNMVGNPYPSPVDYGTVAYAALLSGDIVGSAFYVWNPSLGASGQYQAIPISTSGASPYYVQANTAVQVRADHDGAALHFTETDKNANATNYLFKSLPQSLSLTVYDTNYHPWDMLYLKFNSAATEGDDKYLDATKPSGSDFNFYSLSSDNQKMVIDSRPYNAEKVVPLGISSTYNQEFIIKAENVVVPTGGILYLHDKLLQKYTELKAGTEYRFSITKDKSTQGDNRFEISMKPVVIDDGSGLHVTMTPNPASDDVKIRFSTGKAENVTVRVLDMSGVKVYSKDLGIQLKGIVSVPLSGLASGMYMVELSSGDQKITQRLVKE